MSDTARRLPVLPVGSTGHRSLGWWGMLCVIATEGTLFAYLLFSYGYFAVQLAGNWMPWQPPPLRYALPGIILLLVSAPGMWLGGFGARRGRRAMLLIGLMLALALGCAFGVLQGLDWRIEAVTLREGEFGSVYYTLTGLHLAHLAAGLLGLLLVLVWSVLGYFDASRHAPVLILAAYWYFVVVAGVVVFVALYVLPRVW